MTVFRFQAANSAPDRKVNLQTDDKARAYFEEIGMPNGPDDDNTAIGLEKWSVIRQMRKDGLLKETQTALFVDDSQAHIDKLLAANEQEAQAGPKLAGAWLVIPAPATHAILTRLQAGETS